MMKVLFKSCHLRYRSLSTKREIHVAALPIETIQSHPDMNNCTSVRLNEKKKIPLKAEVHVFTSIFYKHAYYLVSMI